MSDLQKIALQATKDILEKNLQIYHPDIVGEKVVLIYDLDSPLSTFMANGYMQNLKNYPNAEIIKYGEISSSDLKEKILALDAFSTVIMVESTNFRLEEFRIRMSLQHRTVAGIEHNHLTYIREDQIETYLRAVSYQTPYFEKVSEFLKAKNDAGKVMKIVSPEGAVLVLDGGFEDMKQNTGNMPLDARYGSYPIGENFSEVKDFSLTNGEMYIRAYPGEHFEMIFPEKPFKVEVRESRVYADKNTTPEGFLKIMEKIARDEDAEVMMRELGFGLNPAITWEKTLTDVNQFERISGFHLSLGKKHNIYRKKLHKDVVQKYHIDIFPHVAQIFMDDVLIFDSEKHFMVE